MLKLPHDCPLFSLQLTQSEAFLTSKQGLCSSQGICSVARVKLEKKKRVPEGKSAAFHAATSVPEVCKFTVQDLIEVNLCWYAPTPFQITFLELVLLSNLYHFISPDSFGHNQLPNMGRVNFFYNLGSIFFPS